MSHQNIEPRDQEIRAQRFAIRLSLATGVFMLAGKVVAYLMTGSSAVLADGAESVVHLAAVAFAAFSLSWSVQPADDEHRYGHQKIGFFSAGFEGAMIVLAAIYIIYKAAASWIAGLQLENLGWGTLLVAAAGAVNGALGAYLIWQGKRYNSLILEANGHHVLTDCWTSLGVILGLILTLLTGWLPFDPLMAMAVALNILWSGGKLIRRSFAGLMDETDPVVDQRIRELMEGLIAKPLVGYHDLRHRNLGSSHWIEVHLLYAPGTSLDEAHHIASLVEDQLSRSLPEPARVSTHLEPADRHDEHHAQAAAPPDV